MKKIAVNLGALILLLSLSCSSPSSKSTMNPLLSKFDTPFEVPPFDKIKLEHFKPAFDEAIKDHQAEILAISNNPDAPTFENTIEALENAGSTLTQVARIFYNLNSANTSDEMQKIAQEIAPDMSRHSDDINLNPKLFARVKTVWEKRNDLGLDADQFKLLDDAYKGFVRSGANLKDDKKEVLRSINEKLSVLTLKFGQNVLGETNAYELVIENEADLAGLPATLVSSAAETAKKKGLEGKWMFTLQNPSVMPFLQYAENRELRQQIWDAYRKRGDQGNERDNNAILSEITNLRVQRAQLLGYRTHADYVLEESMAKTPANVMGLLNDLWKPAVKKAKTEASDMQKMIKASGQKFKLEPWDWRFYAEQIRKDRYALDENELSEYFSLDAVREGVFYVVNNLYGLQFKPRPDIPVYHEEAKAYQVLDKDGSHLGVLYMDFHPRASKRGGAWMTSYRSQKMENGVRKAPVISIVCNFSRPTGDKPALLTFDEVETFFHEFGHAMHGMLSNVRYASQAGTSVPRDFVELPSQIMENWAGEPEVMKQYAKHYKTGEVIPDELIQKLQNSGTFNQGFATVEYLAASFLDMDYHMQTRPIEGSITERENASMQKIGLPKEIIPRYRSSYFQHIFAGGYSSGYYSYIWSGVLDTDAFDAFKQKGNLFDKELATSFRENVLQKGGTDDPMKLYVTFRGREPKVDALLKKRGLN
ncbi:M3 family peptidase [bacterium]|nr:MAG: M3 family peptidase [bacterium]